MERLSPYFDCWCCGSPLTTSFECPICDMAGLMSPPHLCARTGRLIGDEHDCEPDLPPLRADHETALRDRDEPPAGTEGSRAA